MTKTAAAARKTKSANTADLTIPSHIARPDWLAAAFAAAPPAGAEPVDDAEGCWREALRH
jgi:hypothetical protein